MTIAYWMILIAALLPIITVGLAKGGGSGFDNTDPRHWAERQRNWRRRALSAHQNHFEAFPPFAAAVIVAELTQARQPLIDGLATAFIVLRIIYTAIYLKGWATPRSIVWSCGLICVILLFCGSLISKY